MKSKNNIPENSLKETYFLSNIKKENNFKTPKNYFKVLPEIMSNKSLNNNRLILFFDKLSYRVLIPITSLIIILFVVFYFSNNNTSVKLTHQQLSELIINEDYITIDDDLVYDAYAKLLKEDKNKASSIDEAYINYLIDHDIDINSIIETP